MQISELASAANETPRTIRFYESCGLLANPPRTPGRYREYDASVIDQIRFIRALQGAGLNLDEIAAIVDIVNNPEPLSPRDVQTIADVGTRVDRRLETLTRMRHHLSALVRSGADTTPT